MLDTVVISGDDVCCSVVGVFVVSVMWSEFLLTSAISCPLWSLVYECQSGVCALTFPVRSKCGMFVRVSCFSVRGCAVSRRYVNVCNCDMFSVVNVYLDHSKFCVVCMNGGRYVFCSESNVVSNECNESTSCSV